MRKPWFVYLVLLTAFPSAMQQIAPHATDDDPFAHSFARVGICILAEIPCQGKH